MTADLWAALLRLWLLTVLRAAVVAWPGVVVVAWWVADYEKRHINN